MPRDVAFDEYLAACRPEPMLTVSEWADLHRILPQKASSEPGPWRTSRTPYLRKVLDCLSSSSRYHTVIFAKGAQWYARTRPTAGILLRHRKQSLGGALEPQRS